MMPALIVDKTNCDMCLECEKILPDFMTTHNGYLYIAYARYRDSVMVQHSVDDVMNICPIKAISFARV